MNPQIQMNFPESLTPDEQLAAVKKLQERLEQDFLELGYILNEIKTRKRYTLRGYSSFKAYCQDEVGIKPSLAQNLINVYQTYVVEMKVSEFDVKDIGLDKLNLILPIVKHSDALEREEWIEKAKSNNYDDLKAEVKEINDSKKQKQKTLKELMTDQFYDRFTAIFNVSKKALGFCLALYFADKDVSQVHDEVVQKSRQFEDNPENFYAEEND